MDCESVISQYRERFPQIDDLDESSKQRLALMIGNVQEAVGIDHLIGCLRDNSSMAGDGIIRCYVGFEPSGKAHIGWKVISLQLKRMLEAKTNVLIFLADWHAWVNDKFGGNMEAIQVTAKYMEETFLALLGNPEVGEGPGQVRFLWASKLMEDGDYWARVLRCSKGVTLARVRKTFTIMGRDESSSDNDLSRFYYPAMQAADIFELDIDVAIGGMDQRKAHMYMRDVAEKRKWKKATCLHTPIISSLKSSGARMESFDHKMSKSDPNSALLLHDPVERIKKKMRKAYLDPEDDNSPIYELIQDIILPEFGKVVVTPNPKFGDPSTWESLEDFKSAVKDGTLHPLDAKFGVADGIASGLAEVTNHFDQNPELLDAVTDLMSQ